MTQTAPCPRHQSALLSSTASLSKDGRKGLLPGVCSSAPVSPLLSSRLKPQMRKPLTQRHLVLFGDVGQQRAASRPWANTLPAATGPAPCTFPRQTAGVGSTARTARGTHSTRHAQHAARTARSVQLCSQHPRAGEHRLRHPGEAQAGGGGRRASVSLG